MFDELTFAEAIHKAFLVVAVFNLVVTPGLLDAYTLWTDVRELEALVQFNRLVFHVDDD